MTTYFDHEKLDVYQAALQFVSWADDLLHAVTAAGAARDQLDRASTSIPLNIAEGNGKFSVKDRCRYLGVAYGSALECAACLDVLIAKKLVTSGGVEAGKMKLRDIVAMLNGLVRALRSRVAEERGEYEYEYE